MKKLLPLCAIRLSILIYAVSALTPYISTTIPNYDYELHENEEVTPRHLAQDIPPAKISYSNEEGFKVVIPGELRNFH